MKTVWIFLFFLLSNPLFSQEIHFFSDPITEIPLSNIELVSLDTRDQIYVSTTSGDIHLFDRNGKQLNLFSPIRQGRLTQLEASWTVNIFSFSTDLQEFRILDRFLNPLVEKNLIGEGINLPKAATLGNNNVVWIWDESDLSLKSLNYLQNQILQSQPLNLILESDKLNVLEIREFKNRVFLNVPESGIYLFDNQGNFLQKIELKITQRLCLSRENIFWIEGNKINRYSLVEKKIFPVGDLPPEKIESLQIGQDILILVKKDRIQIFPLPENLKQLR
jgi:hypothetical protein